MTENETKRLTIELDDTTRYILGAAAGRTKSTGTNMPACSIAAACWARLLRQSVPDLSRAEWNFLADVLNGTVDGDWAMGTYEHGAAGLALEVHDAQALNGTGDRWFGEDTQRGSGQAAADALEAKILAMPWPQIRYIWTATAFFWSEPGMAAIDHGRDEWWTIEFRVRTLRAWEAGLAEAAE